MRFRAFSLLVTILFGGAAPNSAQAGTQINTLRELFAAIHQCWTPPPVNHAFAEMEVTMRFSLKSTGEILGEPRITFVTPGVPQATANAYRESVLASLNHCLPLPLSAALGGAIAGRSMAIRFTDHRQKFRQASRIVAPERSVLLRDDERANSHLHGLLAKSPDLASNLFDSSLATCGTSAGHAFRCGIAKASVDQRLRRVEKS